MNAVPPAYVGFWARVGAMLIDTVWTTPLLVPVLALLFGGWRYITPERLVESSASMSEQLILFGALGVLVLPFWFRRRATPGKMAIGARIVDARTLGEPSPRQLVVRYLGYFVSMLPLFLGLLWVAFDRRKQGWHDKLAGTVVVVDGDD